ncbi:MAG: Rab family GTPase [Promethearchaeota archaeon]
MSESKVQKSFIYKICVLGDGGVGKTSMVLRYCENKFKENYIMTIGSNFASKKVVLEDYPEFNVNLQLWDLAGQQHFSFVRPPFYRGASGLIYVFDLTRRSSFTNLAKWKEEAMKVLGSQKPNILIGNKLDLVRDGNREIGEKEGEALAKEFNALAYYETSAKENINVELVFKNLTLGILKASNKI